MTGPVEPVVEERGMETTICRHCGTPGPINAWCGSEQCAERVAAAQARETARILAAIYPHPVVSSARVDEPGTLAEQQARYLAARQHTPSTEGMDYDKAIVAQAEYVLGEAAELFVAVKRQEVNTFTPGQTAWHTRHEVADVVLAVVTLANRLGVTVEDCIAEKTEADRGRG